MDAVIVSTSEHEHAEPPLQAIDLGKPILVEKPLALSLPDAGHSARHPRRPAHHRLFLRPRPRVDASIMTAVETGQKFLDDAEAVLL